MAYIYFKEKFQGEISRSSSENAPSPRRYGGDRDFCAELQDRP